MIAVLERLIEQNQRQPALIAAALVEALKTVNAGSFSPIQTTIELGNYGNSQSSQEGKPSPKLEFAMQWLRQHPEDMLVPGRELEARIMMDGKPISYKWWNQAKKNAAYREDES